MSTTTERRAHRPPTGLTTAKDEVRRILNEMPDDVTLEDIQYHIYICQKVERGLKDADAGRRNGSISSWTDSAGLWFHGAVQGEAAKTDAVVRDEIAIAGLRVMASAAYLPTRISCCPASASSKA